MDMQGPKIAKPPVGNPEIVAMAKQLLDAAMSGQIRSMCVVVANGTEQISLMSSGELPGALALGCEQLKKMLLDKMFDPKGQSRILRA